MFKDGFQKKESGMTDKLLPSWVQVDKKIFDRIKHQIQHAKTNNLQARRELDGSPIYLNKSYKLIQDIEHVAITHEKALKIITDIHNDVKRLDDLDKFNPNQITVLNALFIVDGILLENLSGIN